MVSVTRNASLAPAPSTARRGAITSTSNSKSVATAAIPIPTAASWLPRRAVLALLLLHANETVSSERMIDELWGEEQPATAAKTLQAHVSRLRKALAGGADGPIVTHGHGYELRVGPGRSPVVIV